MQIVGAGPGDRIHRCAEIESAAGCIRPIHDAELLHPIERWAYPLYARDAGCVIDSIQSIEDAVRLAQSAKADLSTVS